MSRKCHTDKQVGNPAAERRDARKREIASDTAREILDRRDLSFKPDRKPVPADAYHDLDHDLS